MAKIEVTCSTCGKKFEKHACWVKRNPRQFCGRSCSSRSKTEHLRQIADRGHLGWTLEGRVRWQAAMSGPNNPSWKGGVTFRRKHGNYGKIKYVRAPEHLAAMARKDGYIAEHRLVMALLAGRVLTRTEVVHHEDHNPTNNSPENLELWPDNRSHKLAEHGRHVEGAANLWCPRDGVLRSSRVGSPSSSSASPSSEPSQRTR